MINKPAVWLLALAMGYKALAGQGPLLVAVDDSLPPYTFACPDRRPAGLDVNRLRHAAQTAGIDIRIEAYPWKRVLSMLQSGQTPLAMPLFWTPERAGFADFIAPVHVSVTALFVLKNHIASDKSWHVADLSGKKIGINRGYALPIELTDAAGSGKIRIEEVDSIEQNVQKLQLGRIDAFIANRDSTENLLQQNGQKTDIVAWLPYLSGLRPAYLVASKALPAASRTKLEIALKRALSADPPNKLPVPASPGEINALCRQ